GHVAMWSILAVGFFNSIMFPCIFTLGVAELGPLTGDGSGLLNMAIVGGAIVPVLQGLIADRIGIHHAFFLPVICYLYIFYYALAGSGPTANELPGTSGRYRTGYGKGALAYQSLRWISNRITVAANGTTRPARRLPVAFEITPTIHGNIAGPSDAKENIAEPMLRAATPRRCEKRATVMGYKVAKLSPVTSAAAVTPGRLDDHSISPIPAVAVAKPACSTRRSGTYFKIRPAAARPNISADQKKTGIMGPIAAPPDPIRATYEPIQPPTAVSAPG